MFGDIFTYIYIHIFIYMGKLTPDIKESRTLLLRLERLGVKHGRKQEIDMHIYICICIYLYIYIYIYIYISRAILRLERLRVKHGRKQ